jgi:hypothetical protein
MKITKRAVPAVIPPHVMKSLPLPMSLLPPPKALIRPLVKRAIRMVAT